ncbi:MAG: hypothetical protein EXS32_05545 [Opitutus sp.]|nr:hypothetical protein [Opitutus sp.]
MHSVRSFLTGVLLLGPGVLRGADPQTILLVDDHDVYYRSGTKRVLRSPVRHPANPLVVGPQLRNQVGYCSLYRDPATGRCQMWYQLGGAGCVVAYAESDDGLKWNEPALGLIARKGNPAPNIVLESPDHYGASVVVDPPGAGDPARRYKMVYLSLPEFAGPFAHPTDHRGPNGGMFVAFSPDGVHWTKHPSLALLGSYGRTQDPPLVGEQYPWGALNSVGDVLDVTFDSLRRAYLVYSKGWIDAPDGKIWWKRAIMRTESTDFIHWSAPQLMMAPDEHDGVEPGKYGSTRNGVQLHGAPVFIDHGVYFALLQVADYETHGLQPIELAVSHDGIAWTRPFRGTPFIPVGEASQFDAGRIWSNSTPIVLEGEIRFYYAAYQHPWKFGQNPYPWDGKTNVPKSGIGLATLPRDRFAGVRPLEKIGHVTLKPRALRAGATLTVNANAAGGALRVELLNERGYRLPGFTKDDAVPITTDGLRHRVVWKTAPTGVIPAGSYQLRLHLENAEVFAVTLQ